MNKNKEWFSTSVISIAAVSIIFASIYLTLYDLDYNSYWWDELYTIKLASKSFTAQLWGDPGIPPLYHTIIYFWIQIFDSAEYSNRLVSVIFYIFSIIAFYTTTRLINRANNSTRLLGTATFAIMWAHMWGARQVRYYSLLLLLSTLAIYYFLKITAKQKVSLGYITVLTLGVITHYGFAILLLVQIIQFSLLRPAFTTLYYTYILPVTILASYLVTRFNVLSLHSSSLSVSDKSSSSLQSIFNYRFDQFKDSPATFKSLFEVLLNYPDNVYITWLYIILISTAILYLYHQKSLTIIDKQLFFFTSSCMIILGVSPLRYIFNNSYYYYIATSALILLTTSLLLKNEMLIRIISISMLIVFLYQNTKHLYKTDSFNREFHDSEYKQIVELLTKNHSFQVFTGYKDASFDLIIYYLHQKNQSCVPDYNEGSINCFSKSKQLANSTKYFYIATPEDEAFWHDVQLNPATLPKVQFQPNLILIERNYKNQP